MFKFTFCVLLSLLIAAPAFAQAPTGLDEHVKTICGHLNTHALEFEEEDKAKCVAELAEVLKEIPAAEQAVFSACVTQYTPITQDQFGACLVAQLDGGAAGMVEPAAPAVTPEITQLCAYLEKNAVEFSDEDAQSCAMMMAMLADMGGEPAKFTKFSSCVLGLPKPADKELEACLLDSGLLPTE